MAITQQQIDQAFVDYRRTYGGVKEDYFSLLYLAEKTKRPPVDVQPQIAFGSRDYGLDGFHVDPEKRNLHLYQFKWSSNAGLFKDSMDRLINAGMERVFGDAFQDRRENPFLAQLRDAMFENRAVVDHVFLDFVFNGDEDEARRNSVLSKRSEDLEAKKHLIDNYFGRDVGLSVRFESNQTRRVEVVRRTNRTHKYEVPVENHVVKELASGETMHVGFVPLLSLHGMYREMGQRLFDRNIRAGLSEDRSPNRAIRSALLEITKGTAEPSSFAFNHNGVTLTADEVTIEDGIARLTEPRVLNGAQTITSVNLFLEKEKDNPALKRNREALEQVEVLAKIVTKAAPEFITTLTIANNKQNPVLPWNLRASDDIQLELHDKFRRDLQLYYERQENAFEALTYQDLEALGVEGNRPIEIKRLAQTFLAAQGEVDKMSRLPEVFENDKLYRSTFRMSYLEADSRKILLAYKVQPRLRGIVEELAASRGKYEFLKRGGNVAWALVIQAILNHVQLNDFCDRWGKSLRIESEFTNEIRKLARTRVKCLVDQLVRVDKYANKIANEKYDFLRTNAFYTEAMDIAYGEYRWKRMPLQ